MFTVSYASLKSRCIAYFVLHWSYTMYCTRNCRNQSKPPAYHTFVLTPIVIKALSLGPNYPFRLSVVRMNLCPASGGWGGLLHFNSRLLSYHNLLCVGLLVGLPIITKIKA